MLRVKYNPSASVGPDGVTMMSLSLKTLSGPADADRFFDLKPQGFENLEVFFLTCLFKSIGTKQILQMLIANHNPSASVGPDDVTMKCYFF